MKCYNPLIITDATLVKLKITKSLEDSLTSKQIRYTIYKDTIPEPTAASIIEGVELIKKNNNEFSMG